MMAYIDSSVILRFVLDQPERLDDARRFEFRVTSALTEVECLRAVDCARLGGRLEEDEHVAGRREVFAQLRRMQRVTPGRSVLRRAGDAFPTPLRALDAIHLATALQWRDRRASELVFATHDRQLGRAAKALGFTVVGI